MCTLAYHKKLLKHMDIFYDGINYFALQQMDVQAIRGIFSIQIVVLLALKSVEKRNRFAVMIAWQDVAVLLVKCYIVVRLQEM